ncbi:MAG: TIGR02302 family protein [Pseudomonadota bacterium]
MSDRTTSRPNIEAQFERKVRRGAWALFLERLWPRLWLPASVLALFAVVTELGAWGRLPMVAHAALLGLLALALVAGIVFAGRVRWPSREESIRRIERVSGIAHRPASSYEDTLSSSAAESAATQTLWRVHRERLAQMLARLRVGTPEPGTHRYDPYALRSLVVLTVALAAVLSPGGFWKRAGKAFDLSGAAAGASARLDAWVTPPPYTGKAPIMLADGGDARSASGEPRRLVEVPEKSALIVRANAMGERRLAIEILSEGGEPERVAAPARSEPTRPGGGAAAAAGDVAEVRHELDRSARVRVLSGERELAQWTFAVTPDQAPTIEMTKPPTRTPRGSMKLTYKAEDDYGVAVAEAKVKKVRKADEDPARAWARTNVLKGPRFPLERPPTLGLRLPRAAAKTAETFSYLELGSHPWSGMRVELWLEARDVAGKVGRSKPVEMVLPGRRFENPVARAVVEQRQKLADDPRYRGQVLTALEALTLEPDGFIDDAAAYLGLRTAYHRLRKDRSRSGIRSVVEQLWHVALRLEDGALSDAERRLREAQEKLAKALEDGASEEEIQRLMQELRQALNEYMQQLAKQAEGREGMQPEGLDPNQQMLGQQDLERMMRNIEEMARSGSREQAQQMLSELRDMLERLQTGRMAEGQNGEKSRQMMERMNELGNLVGEQQKLMDETFSEMRRDGQQGQRGQRGEQQGRQQGRAGQRGQQRPGGQQGQQGEQGERGEDQNGQGQQASRGQMGPGGLGQRQSELRRRLEQLQRDLDELGLGSPDQLDAAREAMQNAEQALEGQQYGEAAEQQGRALDEMRQSAQSMAQQMLQQMPSRYGQTGDSPRDPLGRPQRSQGPDLGTSVKVPDQIDMQRAREILEELRRRLGEATRPEIELDYLERLLRRF